MTNSSVTSVTSATPGPVSSTLTSSTASPALTWNPLIWASMLGALSNFGASWASAAAMPGQSQLPQSTPPPGFAPLPSASPGVGHQIPPPPGFGPRPSPSTDYGTQPMGPTATPPSQRSRYSREATITSAVPIPRASMVTDASQPAPVVHRVPIPRALTGQEAGWHSPGARSEEWDAPESVLDPQDVAMSHVTGDELGDSVMADQLDFEDGSLLSESGVDAEQPPVLSREPAVSSSTGLLEALTTYTDAVKVVTEQRTELSYAEQALGHSHSRSLHNVIQESPIIQRSLRSVQQRFLAPSTAEGSMPGADALSDRASLSQPVGHLAPPPGRNPFRGLNWEFTSFRPRCRPLCISDEEKDRLGVSDRSQRSLAVSDRALRNFEYSAAQGLATVGSLDTMIAALANACLERDESQSSDGRQADSAIRALLSAMADNTQACADYLSTVYHNTVLLRRDILLSASILPAAARASARSIPVTQPFLLGSKAGQVVQDAAAQASSTLALRASVASATKARRPAASGAPPRKAARVATPARPPSGYSTQARRRPVTQQRIQPRRQDQRRAPQKGKHPQ